MGANMYWIFGIAGYVLSLICAWTSLSEVTHVAPGMIQTAPKYPLVVPIVVGPLLMMAVLFAISAFIYFLKNRSTWPSKMDRAFAWGGALTFAFYLLMLM